MASVLTKTMTAEEFYDWVHRPENRDRQFELEEGEVVEMSRPGKKHCLVCSNTVRILGNYTHSKKNGNVFSNDMGIVLDRDPDTVRGGDVAVYLETTPFNEQETKYSEELPTHIVEVLSPNDRMPVMKIRIELFLSKGVAMVWLIDPEEESIIVFLPNHEPIKLMGEDEITGFGVLPDFACKVKEFFASAGRVA